MKQKIALGTVQLGLPYGINNKTGKPDQQEAFRILDTARAHGIVLLDSAEAYGDSLKVIGSYLKSNADQSIKIISKFVSDGKPLRDRLRTSLDVLTCSHLYAYMYHRFTDYKSEKHREELLRLREEGKIQRIGVSLYDLAELEVAIEDREISVIQIPFNLFDNSPKKKALFQQAKKQEKEIHVRSVFLQGLFFKKQDELTGNLQGFSSSVAVLHQLLEEYSLEVRQACLNYALHQSTIDYVLVGVETNEQLIQNINSIMKIFPQEIISALESIQAPDPLLLDPSNWKA